MGSCFDCQTRGPSLRPRGRRRRKHSQPGESCHYISEESRPNTVECSNGCMAAHGVFSNGDESIERWCVDSDKSNDIKALFSYVGSDSRKFSETKDGMKYACNSVYFDDETGAGIRSYNYCWCQGDRCNGNVINGFIKSGGTCAMEHAGAIGLVISIVFSIMVLVGVTNIQYANSTDVNRNDDAHKRRKIGNHSNCSGLTDINCGWTKRLQQQESPGCLSTENLFLGYRKYLLPVNVTSICMKGIYINMLYATSQYEKKCVGKYHFNLSLPFLKKVMLKMDRTGIKDLKWKSNNNTPGILGQDIS